MNRFKSKYQIYFKHDIHSPPNDRLIHLDENPFTPDFTESYADGNLHKWTIGSKFYCAVEIYPIYFLNYPCTDARRVQHVREISEEEFNGP